MENYCNYIADYGSGIANCFYTKFLDDARVAHKGYGGVMK